MNALDPHAWHLSRRHIIGRGSASPQYTISTAIGGMAW
jgi:hypothetical protein